LSFHENRTSPTGNHNFGFCEYARFGCRELKLVISCNRTSIFSGPCPLKTTRKGSKANSDIPTKHCDLRSVTRALVNHIFEGEHVFTCNACADGESTTKFVFYSHSSFCTCAWTSRPEHVITRRFRTNPHLFRKSGTLNWHIKP
jgi:hypothetical protein